MIVNFEGNKYFIMGRKEYNEKIQEILSFRNEILTREPNDEFFNQVGKEKMLDQIEKRISNLRHELEKA